MKEFHIFCPQQTQCVLNRWHMHQGILSKNRKLTGDVQLNANLFQKPLVQPGVPAKFRVEREGHMLSLLYSDNPLIQPG